MRKREKFNNTSFKNKKLLLADAPVFVNTANNLGPKKTIIAVTAEVSSFSLYNNFPFPDALEMEGGVP